MTATLTPSPSRTTTPAPPTTRVARRSSATTPGGFRLRGRVHKAVLTAHILSSVGWFGLALVIAVFVVLAGRGTDPTLPHALFHAVAVTPWLTIPLGVLAAATGVVLSLGTAHGLVRNWWVVAKIAITAAVIATDAVLVSRVAQTAADTGAAPVPLYGSTVAHVVLLLVATVLSVFKPWGRTPWAPNRPGTGPSSSPVPREEQT